MHPYEMRITMRNRGHDKAFPIKESSLYATVQQLADRGFIEAVEVNREGRRPERTVYAITDAGRDELLVWLTELTRVPSGEYPAFAVSLMFIYALGREGAVAALQQRAALLEAEISRSDAFRRAYVANFAEFPRLFGIEEEYAQTMRRAELEWVRTTAAELRDGTFPWPVYEDVEEKGPST
jgi:DNA-binding PadR family transcriptional regulator